MIVGEIVQIKIESLNYSANAVGRMDGFVVFVPLGVPGDTLLIRITQVKQNYAVAELVEVISPSLHRCRPPCVHFLEGCGGCQWQHIAYEYQIEWKKDIIRQALQRIGKLENMPEIEVCIENNHFNYRNKLRVFPVTYAGKMLLGLRKHNTHEVVPIKGCLISNHKINTLSRIFQGGLFSSDSTLNELCIRVRQNQIPPYSPFAKGKSNLQIMLLCNYSKYNLHIKSEIDKLSHIPDVESVFVSIGSQAFSRKYGVPNIIENICGVNYRIGPDSFFQVNQHGLQSLIVIVKNWIGTGNRLILDAHCGVGTFALQIANSCDTVWGTDVSSSAIELARINASDNGINNAYFRKGTMTDVLNSELRGEKLNVAILDPPREGCEKADLESLIESNPEKVLYISCNPTTLARDLRKLSDAGYRLLKLAMIDMFPMTYHLETAAFLIDDKTKNC